jgi:hypothetical protein
LDPRENRSRTVAGGLTLSVGPENADLTGTDDKALQAGLDYLHRLGGGTLEIQAGEYLMRNALYLRSGVAIQGSGENTVPKKAPSCCTPLIADSDWYETQVHIADPSGFSPGCGIMLRSRRDNRLEVIKDTVIRIDGQTLHLSRRLEKNAWLEDGATAATVFPLLTAEWVDDVRVEDLVLDGNRAENEEINGNYAGGVFIQHCDRHTFRNVVSRDYNGDGFSFQVCDDIRFENCRAQNNANLGFHPGSGSQRPIFRGCTARGNSQGIFFCWGVSDGLAENCDLSDNLDYGVTIGHRDTDNRLHNCTIERNHKVGLLFRKPLSEFRGAHRNVVEGCTLRDNGFAAEGIGVQFLGATHDIILRDNRIEDSGAGKQKTGVQVSAEAQEALLAGNTFAGLERDVVYLSADDSSATAS